MVKKIRIPFLLLAMAGLVSGLATGLSRIGWDLNIPETSLHHGAIMVGGFLGTLISLEKIIPLKRKFLFIIPGLSGISVLTFFIGQPFLSFYILSMAATGLAAISVTYLLKERNQIYLLMLAGSLCWLTGNVMLITAEFYPMALPWWIGFVLFIITSERLELMKFLPVSARHKLTLMFFLCLYIASMITSFHGFGNLLGGASLIAIAIWLMHHDMIRISLRQAGLQKFVGLALTSGYVAMLMTGIFLIALNGHAMAYDVIVHTFFLGFAFSMIFAHGPIILPGVLGVSAKPFHSVLYGWLFLLHASWITRVAADVLLDFKFRQITGIASAFAIIAYFLTMAILTIINQRRRHAQVL